MKKYIFIFLISTCFIFKGFTQEIKTSDTQNNTTVLNDYELTDKQFSAWKSILNSWKADDLEKIEFENKIKLNCKSCESFYIDVILKINGNGKLEYYKMTDGSKCGISISKPLEVRIMRNFFKFEYPIELRNTTFKTRLGSALKC